MKYISSKKSIICCTNIQNINQNPTLANNTCALYANIYGSKENFTGKFCFLIWFCSFEKIEMTDSLWPCKDND